MFRVMERNCGREYMGIKQMIIEPKVDRAQEFIEISLDFSNPLDIVREAISNA